MKHSTLVLTASALLVTATVVSFSLAGQTQQSGPPLNQLYPGPLGLANFRKIISGEFTGDWKLDAVVMNGSQPTLIVAPETFDTAIPVGGAAPANDIATLPGVAGAKDKILTVNAAGLRCYERNSANSTWILNTLRDASSPWAGARLVAVAEVNGPPPVDIVGIGANGRDVLIEYANSDGTYTPGVTFQAYGTTVTSLLPLNWRGTGTPVTAEIALISPQGIELREQTGVFIEGLNYTASPIIGTVINDSGTSIQRLATVTRWNGVDRLTIYGDTKTESWMSLGNAGVVSMAAGDVNGDGDTELFLSVNTEAKFWRLDNLSPAVVTYNVSAVTKYAYGAPGRNPAINLAGLAPGDFDSDGALDILAPSQGNPPPTGPFHVYGSIPLVRVQNPNVDPYRADLIGVYYLTYPDQNLIQFHFIKPTQLLSAGSGLTNRLSVKMFHTANLGVGTEKAPVFKSLELIPVGNGDIITTWPVPAGFSLHSSTDLYSLVVRQEVVSAIDNELVYDIAPALTAILTPDPSVVVISSAPETTKVLSIIHFPPDSVDPTGGLDIGPPVPYLDPNEEPKDGDTKP